MGIVILYDTHEPSTLYSFAMWTDLHNTARSNDPTESDVLHGEIRKCPSPCWSRSYQSLSEKRVLRIEILIFFLASLSIFQGNDSCFATSCTTRAWPLV